MIGDLNRRQVLGGMTATALTGAISYRASAAGGARMPNVVFIMADDLGYADLSCTGSRHIRTPAIDSIAANGILLRQGYANSPICSPTRTALLMGRYQYRFRYGLEEPMGPNEERLSLPTDAPTIASVLRDRGYYTKLIGKWHLGRIPENGPLAYGYDDFFGIVEGAGDYFRHNMIFNGQEIGTGLVRENEEIARTGYMTDLLGDDAVATIAGAVPDRPFFLSLHFTAPHWPWEGPEDKAVSDQMTDVIHRDGGNLATYARMVESMDANIAKVVAALKRKGVYEDTIVVFTSDNGGERFSDTWPFIGNKGEVLEGGIRVPILAQWPGRIPRGSRSEQVMVSMDFLPTLLTMAGGSAAAGTFDGIDLSRQLIGGSSIERTLFWRFKGNEQAAVRKGDWKYIRLGGKEQLFDLSADERERADLIRKLPSKAAELMALYDAWNAQMLPYPLGSRTDDLSQNYIDRY
jgi:arylsulfatase A-like enzyme